MPELDGTVAIVTGASRGIGKGLALGLAAAGASVTCAARTLLDGEHELPGTVTATVDEIRVAGVIATASFILVPSGLWLLFSLRAFPHPEEAGWKAMVPGALLVGVGLQLLHIFTVLWIARQVDSKSDTYGAIGIALALLFWAYLTGRIFMAGMVVNASQWYRSHDRPESEQQPEEMLDA